METVFRWLARLLAGILEKYADPDLQARVDAFNAKVADQEIARARLMEQIRAGERQLIALTQTLTDNQRKEAELENAIQRSKDETELLEERLDSLSGGDRVRVDL